MHGAASRRHDFPSAQTAGQGRNVVLFNHAAGIESYALPSGTRVKIDMGWGSEDDPNDSIAVWETVPAEKAAEKTGANSDTPDFSAILKAASSEPAEVTDERDLFCREPTLKLDVQNIQVFQIRAVSYEKSQRSVLRYRRSTDEQLDF